MSASPSPSPSPSPAMAPPPGPLPQAIAHRGHKARAPENTMLAFRAAVCDADARAPAIEGAGPAARRPSRSMACRLDPDAPRAG